MFLVYGVLRSTCHLAATLWNDQAEEMWAGVIFFYTAMGLVKTNYCHLQLPYNALYAVYVMPKNMYNQYPWKEDTQRKHEVWRDGWKSFSGFRICDRRKAEHSWSNLIAKLLHAFLKYDSRRGSCTFLKVCLSESGMSYIIPCDHSESLGGGTHPLTPPKKGNYKPFPGQSNTGHSKRVYLLNVCDGQEMDWVLQHFVL